MKKGRIYCSAIGFVVAMVLTLVLCMGEAAMAEESRSVKDSRTSELETKFNEAVAVIGKGEYDKALVLADKIVDRFPDNHNVFWLRSVIYYKLKKYDLAKADIKQVNTLAPDFVDAYGQLCWILIVEGKFADAKPACEKAQTLAPYNVAASVNLGHVYLLTEDLKKAHEYYKNVIPLIKTEEEFTKQVDFELLIEKGWQIAAAKKEMNWMREEWEKTKMVRKAEEEKELSGVDYTGLDKMALTMGNNTKVLRGINEKGELGLEYVAYDKEKMVIIIPDKDKQPIKYRYDFAKRTLTKNDQPVVKYPMQTIMSVLNAFQAKYPKVQTSVYGDKK